VGSPEVDVAPARERVRQPPRAADPFDLAVRGGHDLTQIIGGEVSVICT
jgi:hypothetical protein